MTAMKVALIGLGNAGTNLHLPALAGLPDATVVGGCDPDPDRRAEAERRFTLTTFDDVEPMLNATRPDMVIVATPPDSHAEYIRQIVAFGADVLCEKPFVSSIREADEVIALARDAGRRVAVNHEFREMEIFRALHDRVGTDGVGDLVVAQVWQLMDLAPWDEAGWRSRMPGRSFFEGGIHLLDYVMMLFGEMPRAVQAVMSSCGRGSEDGDAVTSVTLEFSGGRLAQIMQNRLCPGETQYFEVRADCREASLRASFGGRARLSAGLHRSTRPHVRFEFGASGVAWKEKGHTRHFFARNPRNPPMAATRAVLTRTLQAFASGSSPSATAEDGRNALLVLAAVYRSAETGRRIDLQTLPLDEVADLAMGALPADAA